jgi:hypothetical protein
MPGTEMLSCGGSATSNIHLQGYDYGIYGTLPEIFRLINHWKNQKGPNIISYARSHDGTRWVTGRFTDGIDKPSIKVIIDSSFQESLGNIVRATLAEGLFSGFIGEIPFQVGMLIATYGDFMTVSEPILNAITSQVEGKIPAHLLKKLAKELKSKLTGKKYFVTFTNYTACKNDRSSKLLGRIVYDMDKNKATPFEAICYAFAYATNVTLNHIIQQRHLPAQPVIMHDYAEPELLHSSTIQSAYSTQY